MIETCKACEGAKYIYKLGGLKVDCVQCFGKGHIDTSHAKEQLDTSAFDINYSNNITIPVRIKRKYTRKIKPELFV